MLTTDAALVRRAVLEIRSAVGVKAIRSAVKLMYELDAGVATQAGAIPVLVEAVARRGQPEMAVVFLVGALQRLTAEHAPARNAFIDASGVHTLSSLLNEFGASVNFVSAFGGILHNVICSGASSRSALAAAGGIEALAAVADKGAADADVTRLALSDLAMVAAVSTNAQAAVSAAGAVGLALRALRSFPAHAPIVTAAGMLFLNIAADDAAAKEAMRGGAVPALLTAVERGRRGTWRVDPLPDFHPGAVAANALRALAMNASAAESVSRAFLALGGMAVLVRTPTSVGGSAAGASSGAFSARALEAALALVHALTNVQECKADARAALSAAGGAPWLLAAAELCEPGGGGGGASDPALLTASMVARAVMRAWVTDALGDESSGPLGRAAAEEGPASEAAAAAAAAADAEAAGPAASGASGDLTSGLGLLLANAGTGMPLALLAAGTEVSA